MKSQAAFCLAWLMALRQKVLEEEEEEDGRRKENKLRKGARQRGRNKIKTSGSLFHRVNQVSTACNSTEKNMTQVPILNKKGKKNT